MPKLLGSGTLQDVSEFSEIYNVSENYTGVFGLQLSGTFGATGRITLAGGKPGDVIRCKLVDVNDGSSSWYFEMTEAGLYVWRGFTGGIQVRLTVGTNGVTDIDYNLFVGART